MTTRNTLLTQAGLTFGALAYGLLLYPKLPALIPIHWNWRGEVDGYAPKEVVIFLMPGCMALFLALTAGLPRLSTRRFDLNSFRATYDYLMLVTTGLFAYVHFVMLQAALFPDMDSGRLLMGGMFGFFGLMGNVMGRVRRNEWVGVRTPWTLADERVWDATHRLAGQLMVGAGVAGGIFCLLHAPLWLPIALLVAALLWPAAYSYVLFKRYNR